MPSLIICYDFNFNVVVQTSKGRIYKNYNALASGQNYNAALWSLYFDLKKKRKVLITVNKVMAIRICFALSEKSEHLQLNLADYPPEIPEDLNADVKQLPKKNSY